MASTQDRKPMMTPTQGVKTQRSYQSHPPIPKLNLLRVNGSSADLLINLTTPGDCNIKIISWPTHQREVPRRCHFIFQCPLPQPAKTYCYIN